MLDSGLCVAIPTSHLGYLSSSQECTELCNHNTQLFQLVLICFKHEIKEELEVEICAISILGAHLSQSLRYTELTFLETRNFSWEVPVNH